MIAGKPLLEWTVQEAVKSARITNYVISTDESDPLSSIIQSGLRHGVPPIFRPTELAQDDTPSLDVIRHVLGNIGEGGYDYGGGNVSFDAIALIPCTTPLRTAEDIDNAIQMLEDNPIADSVIGMTECLPVERVKKIVDGLIVDTFPEPRDGQRQFLEKCYARSGIYAVRVDSLDKLFGHATSLAYVMPQERAVNIDTMLDWKLAEVLLKEREGLL